MFIPISVNWSSLDSTGLLDKRSTWYAVYAYSSRLQSFPKRQVRPTGLTRSILEQWRQRSGTWSVSVQRKNGEAANGFQFNWLINQLNSTDEVMDIGYYILLYTGMWQQECGTRSLLSSGKREKGCEWLSVHLMDQLNWIDEVNESMNKLLYPWVLCVKCVLNVGYRCDICCCCCCCLLLSETDHITPHLNIPLESIEVWMIYLR